MKSRNAWPADTSIPPLSEHRRLCAFPTYVPACIGGSQARTTLVACECPICLFNRGDAPTDVKPLTGPRRGGRPEAAGLLGVLGQAKNRLGQGVGGSDRRKQRSGTSIADLAQHAAITDNTR